MALGVHSFHVFGVNTGLKWFLDYIKSQKSKKTYLDVLREVFFEFFFIFFFKRVHVFSDVETHDVFLVDFSVEFTFGKSWESFWRVWNVQTSISSTLQDTEDTGTS